MADHESHISTCFYTKTNHAVYQIVESSARIDYFTFFFEKKNHHHQQQQTKKKVLIISFVLTHQNVSQRLFFSNYLNEYSFLVIESVTKPLHKNLYQGRRNWFQSEAAMEHWKLLPATMVGWQGKCLNSRRSGMAETVTFWPQSQRFKKFCLKSFSCFPLFPFFLFTTQ